MFKKKHQHVTITSNSKENAEAIWASLKSKNLRNASISSIMFDDEEVRFQIDCWDVEELCEQEIVPLLYTVNDPNSFQIIVQFDDDAKSAKFYEKENLLSFQLNSGRAFGDDRERECIRDLHGHFRKTKGSGAAVTYYIISGGAVTMAIACVEPDKIETYLVDRFGAEGITHYLINTVNREAE